MNAAFCSELFMKSCILLTHFWQLKAKTQFLIFDVLHVFFSLHACSCFVCTHLNISACAGFTWAEVYNGFWIVLCTEAQQALFSIHESVLKMCFRAAFCHHISNIYACVNHARIILLVDGKIEQKINSLIIFNMFGLSGCFWNGSHAIPM